MAAIRELPSGNWQARVMVNGKYVPLGTYPTKKEAEVIASDAERKVYYNETLTDRKMKFNKVIDDWFQHKSRTVKDSTFEQIEVIKRLHIEKYFGNRVLYDISRDDVLDWVQKYEDKVDKNGNEKYSYGTRLKYLVTLKDIFNHAVHIMEVLHKSPAAKVQIKTKGQVSIRRDIKYYSLNELDFLLDYFKEYKPPRYKEYNPYYVLIYLLSRTGLRIGEALSLQWSDIDNNRLNIDKQASRDSKNHFRETTLKTASSYRNIEIDDDTVQLLMEFRKIQQKMVLKYPKFVRNENLIIFQTYKGNYMTPSTVRETIKAHCIRAGVEYKGTHSFRHTHAVLALESGADLLYISRRLGHGSIQTTADTYLDVTPQYESHELSKISQHLNSKWHENGTKQEIIK